MIPPSEEAANLALRAYADHFHQVMFCEVPKAGSTSWFTMFRRLMQKEKDVREKWFQQHVYDWYGGHDRYAYVNFITSLSTIYPTYLI